MTVTDSTMDEFQNDLAGLLNSHSIENECDMPDFLLADMVVGFIKGVGQHIKKTLDWHGCNSITHPSPKMEKAAIVSCLTGSEAIFGFCGWLTSRKERTIMSGSNDSAVIVELITKFCNENKLSDPRDNYTDYLTLPSD